jgi:hypothetical protein
VCWQNCSSTASGTRSDDSASPLQAIGGGGDGDGDDGGGHGIGARTASRVDPWGRTLSSSGLPSIDDAPDVVSAYDP